MQYFSVELAHSLVFENDFYFVRFVFVRKRRRHSGTDLESTTRINCVWFTGVCSAAYMTWVAGTCWMTAQLKVNIESKIAIETIAHAVNELYVYMGSLRSRPYAPQIYID